MANNQKIDNTNKFKSNKVSDNAGNLIVNRDNIFAAQDYMLVINAYEKNVTFQENENSVVSSHYKDVYSTRNFSERMQEQMNYYPGMHQSSNISKEDPLYRNAAEQSEDRLNYWNNSMSNPNSFMNAARDSQQDFDYTTIFGSDASAKTRAEQAGKILTECIPCFNRIWNKDQLLPTGDLLEVHTININSRFDLLDQINDLLNNPGNYIDICELLKYLTKMCPNDLIAMITMLSRQLARINLDVSFNIDFITNLVGPILSPFLDQFSQWIDKWIQLIIEPMICIIDNLNETIITAQQAKIPFSDAQLNTEADLGVGILDTNLSKDGKSLSWTKDEVDRFDNTRRQQNKLQRPEFPDEEISLALQETKEGFKPSLSEAERKQVNNKWEELRRKQAKKVQDDRLLQQEIRNGTRWSSDNVPNSEKGLGFNDAYYPPEKQVEVKESNYYININPLTNALVQLRNTLQGSVQYSRDWFTYTTQMVYDLLGQDVGFMQNKIGNNILKTNITRYILIIKSILNAINKNGLICGENTNYDIKQEKYILEDTLSRVSPFDFTVQDNGDIIASLPTDSNIPSTTNNSIDVIPQDQDTTLTPEEEAINIGVEFGSVSAVAKNTPDQQQPIQKQFTIKKCLQNVSSDELNEVKKWITEYERKQ